MDPPHREIHAGLAREHADVEVSKEVPDGEHRRSVGVDVHPLARLSQDGAEHGLDLGELLGAGDQRR